MRTNEKQWSAVDRNRRPTRPAVLEFCRHLREIVRAPPRDARCVGTGIGDADEIPIGGSPDVVLAGATNRLEPHAGVCGSHVEPSRNVRVASAFEETARPPRPRLMDEQHTGMRESRAGHGVTAHFRVNRTAECPRSHATPR
jgi:hypothetical protein